jgi:hypothetical protein
MLGGKSLRGGMDGVAGKSLRGGMSPDVLALRPDIVVRHIRQTISRRRHGAAVRPAEEPAVPVVFADCEATLVTQLVMRLAQEHQVIETRLAAVRPVFYVMRIDEALAAAARKTTASVTRP